MNKHLNRAVLAALACVVIATPVAAEDWATWRGPAGDGISRETNWNPKAVESPGAVAWKIDVGKGHSAVAVVGDRAYTMGSKLKDGEVVAEAVYSIDTNTGRVAWEYAYPAEHRDYPGPGGTPVVEQGKLFTVGRDGKIHCFDAASGSVIWRVDLDADGIAEPEYWGFNGSVLIDGNLVIINANTAGLALDKRNGKLVWNSEAGRNGHATPVPFEQNGKRLVGIVGAGSLQVVEPQTGKVVGSHRWNAHRDPAAVTGGLLMTGGFRGQGSSRLAMGEDDIEEQWQNRNLAGEFMTGVVMDGFAYGFGRSGRSQPLQCINTETGELNWSENLGAYGSLMGAGGKLIIIDGDGDLLVAEATPEEFKVVSRAKVFSNIKNYDSYPDGDPDHCWTAPVLSNGRIYVRSSYGQLACIKVAG
ncbi:MAG: PQQ-binding-like beta-propeller repeat protein [bacterium]|nr:PQQ-binding-like beta-propeller repeat protein [bacterium]